MKNKLPERLHNSIEALQKAFLDDTLMAGQCHCCAVGNLVAHAQKSYPKASPGFIYPPEELSNLQWFTALCVHRDIYHTNPWHESEGIDQIKATGYSLEEVDRIERVFEQTDTKYHDLDKDLRTWKALQAVLKLLYKFEDIPYDEEIEAPFLAKLEEV